MVEEKKSFFSFFIFWVGSIGNFKTLLIIFFKSVALLLEFKNGIFGCFTCKVTRATVA
jgi:hypothetical protein